MPTGRIARLLWLAAVVCVVCSVVAFLVGAVGFVGLGIKLWQDGNGLPFDAVAARMRQFRVWVYAAISLFGTACVILWFLPDRPDADDSQ